MGRIKALIETDLGLVDSARPAVEEALRLAEERSDEVNVFTCLGVLGRLELELGNHEAAGARLREFPATRALARLQGSDGAVLGGLDRDADPARRARAGPRLSRAVRGERRPRSRSVGMAAAARAVGCSGRQRRSGRCVRCLRSSTCDARGAAVSAGARSHPALPRHRPPTGPAEEGRPGGARAGARDLRGARRPALGREGPCRARADQRSRACLRTS